MAAVQSIGVPPHNLTAERSALGAVLLDERHLQSLLIEENLSAEHFFREQHAEVWAAMIALYQSDRKIDHLTVAEALAERGKLEAVGGVEAIEELVSWVPAAGNAREYGRIVRENAQKRSILKATYEIQADVLGGEGPTRDLVERAERSMLEAAHDPTQKKIRTIRDILDEETERLHLLSTSKTAISGTPSGFKDLDDKTGGFQPGNLIILAARPSMGKSALVTNMAENAVLQGKAVALFSLEMSESELAQRFVASQAKIKGEELRRGKIPEAQWPRILEACQRLAQAPLFVDDSSDASVLDIRAKCRRLHGQLPHGLGLIIVDYLQLMRADGRIESRVEQVGQISRGLKGLARELAVPVIALSQLSRAVEQRGGEKKPILSDLRECVTGDTPVLLADGSRVPVSELVGTRPEVLSVDERGEIVPAQSQAVWPVGVREVREITLASGRTLRATDDHRLLCDEGWLPVRELSASHSLALAASLPEAHHAEQWSGERVILLGHLLGSPNRLGDGGNLSLTTSRLQNARVVGEAAGIEFGARAWHSRAAGGHRVSLDGGGNGWSQTRLRPWLAELGILGTSPEQRRVPRGVFRLGSAQIGLLLRHLWAAAGTIGPEIALSQPADHSPRAFIRLTVAGEAMAADVAALLLRLGITTRRLSRGRHGMCELTVAGERAHQRFLRRVGAFGHLEGAARRLDALLGPEHEQERGLLEGGEIFARRYGRAAAGLAAVTGDGMGSVALADREDGFRSDPVGPASFGPFAPDDGSAGSPGSGGSPGSAVLSGPPGSSGSSESSGSSGSPGSSGYGQLSYDRIVSIRRAGSEPVYDLTVPGNECWLADGIVSHNSGQIEQDADLVMFIYREEYYDRESERAGEADIIIAKHRNGPVGEIVLAFQKDYPRFMNYAGERFAP